MVLKTDRLTLRPLTETDAPWIATEIANPMVHKWLTSVPRPYGIEDALEFIARNTFDPGYFVIDIASQPQGAITIGRNLEGASELGYWLKQSAWGQGYMTEAAQAVLATHFATSGEAVESGWIKGNQASANVLGKLGFQPAPDLMRYSCYYGKDVALRRVVLTKAQWADGARSGKHG